MTPRSLDASTLAALLPAGSLTLVSGCAAESGLLAGMVADAGDALHDVAFSGVFVPGLNRADWLANPAATALSFFMTPALAGHGGRVDFRALCYQDIAALLKARRPQAALVMLSPPDADGLCSFGVEQGFIPDLWDDIPVKLAHLNPAMPRTRGHPGVRFDQLTAVIEADVPLLTAKAETADAAAEAIGRHAAAFVPDGATLQIGLGWVPAAILAALHGHRALRLHTGLIGDAVLALIDAGATAGEGAVTAGAAIGSRRLYDRLAAPDFAMHPVTVTHDPNRISACRNFVAINSALEVDLFGQAYAERTPAGWMSGPGGASDFARAARLSGGLRIVALPAAAGEISRIVPPGAGAGPVSLGRMDVDLVVTEHGAADLRGKGHDARAEALIDIADPPHRPRLAEAWRRFASPH